MTNSKSPKRSAGSPRPDPETHLFKIGQTVRMTDRTAARVLPGSVHTITGMLPPRGSHPQYRIRNENERHERVVTQDCLEPVVMPQHGSSTDLIERTFNHG
ncbi:MAG: hypothetical protein ABJL55_21315 [Roseibium sp.]